MNIQLSKNQKGFTLIEMMLVMVVIGMLLYAGMNYMQQKAQASRIDRTALQMQQILNAGLAYYVNEGSWPVVTPEVFAGIDVSLQKEGYLLPGAMNNPWGQTDPENHPTSYSLITDRGSKMLTVVTYIGKTQKDITNAQIIAGKLPMGLTCQSFAKYDVNGINVTCAACANTKPCYVGASVNVPGQNLNNATAINYAGLYHSGSCVKVPSCPFGAPDMIPSVMVVPVSVTGVNDAPTDMGGCSPSNLAACQVNSYPITSFSGVALGPASNAGGNVSPPNCTTGAIQTCLADSTGMPIKDTDLKAQYWRVCLKVASSKGNVSPTTNPWGQIMGTVMVLTRCASAKEHATDSGFDVYQ